MPKTIVWVDRPPNSGGGRETIYKNQYFRVAQYAGLSLSSIEYGFLGIGGYVSHNSFTCVYCGQGGVDYAVRKFKPTAKNRTQYTDWEACPERFCHRLRLKINGRRYWARWNPLKKRFMVFNRHHGRRPIGTLPKYMVPKHLWEQFT